MTTTTKESIMYEAHEPVTAWKLRLNSVIKIENDFVLITSADDFRANKRVAGPGTVTFTYTDTDAITSRAETFVVDRHLPIMTYVWKN